MLGFVWDFDGVIVETPHEKAWRIACERLGITGFTSNFYHEYVSGKPRLEGAWNILSKLANRSPSQTEVETLASLKTNIYLELIEKGEYQLRTDVIRFIQRARLEGIIQVLASASRNVHRLIEVERKKSGLELAVLFDIDVSGSGATKKEVFKNAIEKLKKIFHENIECILFFDDAPSGILAAKSLNQKAIGCFHRELLNYGADAVIEDFSNIPLQEFLNKVGCKI